MSLKNLKLEYKLTIDETVRATKQIQNKLQLIKIKSINDSITIRFKKF